MTTQAPIGPRRVLDQATAAGFDARVRHGQANSSEAWQVAGEKGDRGFAGLWIKTGDAGVKALGLWTWGPGTGVVSIKLAEFRTWVTR